MWGLLARNGTFRRLWVAATVDAFGTWLLVTAVPVEVFARTGSPGSTGLALAVEAGPALLLGPWAGAVADRLPRARVLLGADLAAAAGVALMLVPGVRYLYLGVATESVAVCFIAPAVQASVPLVAPDLAAANGALAVSQSTWRVLGPLIGAAAAAAGRFPVVVAADALSYLAAAAIVAGMPLPAPPAARGASRREVRAGLTFVARRPVLRAIMAGSCLYWTANAGLTALLVPFVAGRLHAGGAAVGYLVTGLGLGYLAGSALARRLLVRGPRVVAVAYALAGVCFLVLVTAPTLPVAVAAVTASGLPGAAALAATGHCLQVEAPDALRGRVSAAFRTSDALAAIAGAVTAPALVALAGLGGALIGLASTVLVAALLTDRLLRRHHETAPAS
ncbi:MFS transporter [Actinoplanes sp. NPDC051343]|uniref:MFS transporter n=1 Tax=Actinoplanes sp. NPDC051343 TaxID=3363906 RepID=UPI00379077A9